MDEKIKVCVFCGKRANSDEDVWPRWLLKFIGGTTHRMDVVGKDARVKRSWPGNRLLVNRVCRECNNGWMSRLEDRCKPLIVHMSAGTPITLTRDDAVALATWAAKTTMMLDYAGARPSPYYKVSECAYLKNYLTPPPGTTIWLASVSRCSYEVYSNGRDLFKGISIPGLPIRGYMATLAVRHLAFQALAVGVDMDGETRPNFPAAKELKKYETMTWVWPWPTGITEISWPPSKQLFGTAELDALSKSLGLPA
jgi:hypothetical protein